VESEKAESEEAEPELELFSEEGYLLLNKKVVCCPPPNSNVASSSPLDEKVVREPPPNESIVHDLPPHENVVRSPPSDRNVVCSPPPNENVVYGPLKNRQKGKSILWKIARLPAEQSQTWSSSRGRRTARIRKRPCGWPIDNRRPWRNVWDIPSHKNRARVRHRRSKSLKKRARRRQHRGRRRCVRSRSRSFSSSSESGRENSGHGSPPVGGEMAAGTRARERVLLRAIVFDRGKSYQPSRRNESKNYV